MPPRRLAAKDDRKRRRTASPGERGLTRCQPWPNSEVELRGRMPPRRLAAKDDRKRRRTASPGERGLTGSHRARPCARPYGRLRRASLLLQRCHRAHPCARPYGRLRREYRHHAFCRGRACPARTEAIRSRTGRVQIDSAICGPTSRAQTQSDECNIRQDASTGRLLH